MSEYQYYEFLAIDRPLGKDAQAELRALSSRARITATGFVNSYEWGDFKGDPNALMEEWFDLHIYLANWGTRRLTIRVPERFVDRRVVEACLVSSDCAKVRVVGDHLILDIECHELDTDWDEEGDGWLAALAQLRTDLLAGDMRSLYLIWLIAVQCELLGEDALEPMPGIGPLSGPLDAFATFFCLNPDLVQAAAEREGVPDRNSVPSDAALEAITAMDDREKTALLSRLLDGDPHVATELRAAVRGRMDAGHETTVPAPRTVGELQVRAREIGLAREQAAERRQAEERERIAWEEEEKRRERLLAIARRGEGVWREVEAEIERSNASAYDRAAGLLLDLRTVSAERDALPDFTGRILEIRERHARKARFLQRIGDLG